MLVTPAEKKRITQRLAAIAAEERGLLEAAKAKDIFIIAADPCEVCGEHQWAFVHKEPVQGGYDAISGRVRHAWKPKYSRAEVAAANAARDVYDEKVRKLTEEERRLEAHLKGAATGVVPDSVPGWLEKVLGLKSQWRPKLEKAIGIKLDKILGCGHYGCVFRSSDQKWVVKVTRDNTEGPMQALIRDKQRAGEYGMDGFTIVREVYELPVPVKWRRYDSPQIYVIVREDVTPLKAPRPGYYDGLGPGREFVPGVNPRITYAQRDRSIDALHRYKDAAAKWYEAKERAAAAEARGDHYNARRAREQMDTRGTFMMNQIDDISIAFPYISTAMAKFQDEERPLRDVHANNIGIRVHGDIEGAEDAIGAVVIFDPGHTPTKSEGAIVRVNPQRRWP